jgi:hypothetical protein
MTLAAGLQAVRWPVGLLVGSSISLKQQLRGSVRNSAAVIRRDAVGYGQHFWHPA